MTEKDVMDLFYQSGAMLEGHFLLSSGRHGDVYFEKFTLLRQPRVTEKLCAALADKFKDQGIELVVGPTTGGVIVAYEVARHLGIDAIYAEPAPDAKSRIFKRGFSIDPGQKILIVDDISTTGRSVYEVIDLCRTYDAVIVGIGLFMDRSGGQTKFDYPCHALANVSAKSWAPDDCPLCREGKPITQRGSRKL